MVLAMAEPKGRRRFLLGWSAWRRAHQAVAARCRKASLAAKRAALRAKRPPEVAALAPKEAHSPTSSGRWFIHCCRRRGAG